MSYFIEACCQDLGSLRRAVQAGANRIEFCSDLAIGGVTPPYLLARSALALAGNVPVNVLIRPRGGNFVYTQEEVDRMLESVSVFKTIGVNGVVIGALKADGSVDTDTVSRLVREAGSLDITFHRAFDECKDLNKALEDIIGLGIKRVLTSGGCPTAYEGRFVLRDLVRQAAGRITVMPGCGVRASNIDEIASVTGAVEFHGSQLP
ncbi:MAG: copper homeostasis protein CutC [Bacteroidales bacterium]|nr:copper homeostasis protein CutC [Bacteroidales bacterium]